MVFFSGSQPDKEQLLYAWGWLRNTFDAWCECDSMLPSHKTRFTTAA